MTGAPRRSSRGAPAASGGSATEEQARITAEAELGRAIVPRGGKANELASVNLSMRYSNLNPKLPSAIKTAMSRSTQAVQIMLYRLSEKEGEGDSFVPGSSKLQWNFSRPLEEMFDIIGKRFGGGTYRIKLLFAGIDPSLNDQEFLQTIEAYVPDAEEMPPMPPAPQQSSDTPTILESVFNQMNTMMDRMEQNQSAALERIADLVGGVAPRPDPMARMLEMIQEQNNTLITALAGNRHETPAGPAASIGELVGAMKTLQTMTGGAATAVKTGFEEIADAAEKLNSIKKLLDPLMGRSRAGAYLDEEKAEINAGKKTLSDVAINLLEKFGDKALPMVAQVIGKAVVNGMTSEDMSQARAAVGGAAHHGTKVPLTKVPLRGTLVRPVPSRPAAPAPGGSTVQAAPAVPGETRRLDFPTGIPAAAAQPADEIQVNIPSSFPALLEQIEKQFAAGAAMEDIADDTADALDEINPGWQTQYAGQELTGLQLEMYEGALLVRESLKPYEQKMYELIEHLHKMASDEIKAEMAQVPHAPAPADEPGDQLDNGAGNAN